VEALQHKGDIIMEVQIKAKGLPAAKNLRNHAARRVRSALERFGHAIQSVTVRMSDINGPRGGADKLCRIVIQMKNRSVVMEELGSDMRRVVDRLSDRVQYSVSRQMGKLTRVSRLVPVALPEPSAA